MMIRYLKIIPVLFLYSSTAWTTEEIGLEILDTCLSERKAITQQGPVFHRAGKNQIYQNQFYLEVSEDSSPCA